MACSSVLRLALATCTAVGCGRGATPSERSAEIVTIGVDVPGRASAEVEALVVIPLEHALASVPEAKLIRAVSTAGHAAVTVELTPGADLWRARSIIVAQVDQASLPEDVHPYLGPPAGGADDVFVVTSDRASRAELRSMQDDWIRPQLLQVEGIVDVAGCGGGIAELEIVLDGPRLQARDLSAADVATALLETTSSASAGGYVSGSGSADYIVRGGALGMDELRAIRLGARDSSVPITLADVADVRRTERPAPCQAVLGDGAATVAAHVQYGGTTARGKVRARLEELRPALPPGAHVDPLGRADDPGSTRWFRIATVPSADPAELARVADRVVRTARDADGALRALVLFGDEAGTWDRLAGEIDLIVDFAPGAAANGSARTMDLLHALPGITIRRPRAPRSARLVIELVGSDRTSLSAAASQLRALVAAVAGVEVAVTPGTAALPQRSIAMDRRRMATLGVSSRDVVEAVEMATDGVPVGRFVEGSRALPVVLRWAGPRREPDQLARLPLRTPNGAWIVLADVATFQVEEQPVALVRTGGAPSTSVWIEVDPRDADRVKREIRRRVAAVALPPGTFLTLR